jgi:hypothetical protein
VPAARPGPIYSHRERSWLSLQITSPWFIHHSVLCDFTVHTELSRTPREDIYLRYNSGAGILSATCGVSMSGRGKGIVFARNVQIDSGPKPYPTQFVPPSLSLCVNRPEGETDLTTTPAYLLTYLLYGAESFLRS